MIDTLPSYPAYKDSGLPWLGQVPEHWEVRPNRGLLRKRKKLVGEHFNDYNLLSLTKQGVIVRDISQGKGKFSADMGTSQEVRAGDFVFCLFDVPETPRTVGLSQHNGMITGAYTVFESLGHVNTSYLELFYISLDDRKLLSPLYSGLRNTIPTQRFLGTKSPLPPPAEQAAIVRFLEWAGGRLERTIRAKRKIIALLNEQKQAIIHRAVTRGLDPDVPLKDSGIPWLGEIPAHWEVVPSKALFKQRREKARDEDEILTASQSHGIISRSKFMELEGRRVMQVFIGSDILKHIEPNDFVMSMRSFEGGLEWSHISGSVSSAYVALIPASSVHCPYFAYALKSKFYISDLRRTSDLVRDGQALRYFNFGKVALPLVPWSEQVDIAKYIDQKCDVIHSAISRLEREIELLREYRTRLISDVVTGKLDVRAAAATLPDEPSIDSLVATHDVLADDADEALDTTEDV